MDQQGSSVQDQMRMMLTDHGLAPASQPKVGLAPGGGARGLKKQDSLVRWWAGVNVGVGEVSIEKWRGMEREFTV
jgi:hypothetical protein